MPGLAAPGSGAAGIVLFSQIGLFGGAGLAVDLVLVIQLVPEDADLMGLVDRVELADLVGLVDLVDLAAELVLDVGKLDVSVAP